MRSTVYIGFGSNLGDLPANFLRARALLSATPGVFALRQSKLYSSAPLTLRGEEQPAYLNAVFEITTELKPHALFSELKKIEILMGRKSKRRWAPRVVDLDILFFDNLVYCDEEISLPHREAAHRDFVLKPLCDLAPHLLHPEFQMTATELLESLATKYVMAVADDLVLEGASVA